MMNDKIRLAAEVLAALGEGVDGKVYERALAQPQADVHLRAAFLAGVIREGLQKTVNTVFDALRDEFDKVSGRLEDGPRALLELVQDEDVLSPADRAATSAMLGQFGRALRYPHVLECLERLWPMDYNQNAFFLWTFALHEKATPEAAKRLAERTDADRVPVGALSDYIANPQTLEVLAARMSTAALLREYGALCEKIEEKKSWTSSRMISPVLVLLVEMAGREGADLTVCHRFLDSLMERGQVARRTEQGFPYFARLAVALGRANDPRVFAAVREEGLDHLPAADLERLLQAGMPAQGPGRDGLTYLLEVASLEQIPAIAAHMSEADRAAYVQDRLKHAVTKLGWNVERTTCMSESVLTALHRAGFDLGVPIRDAKGQEGHLHDAPGAYYQGGATKFVFTALHALGAYPKDLQLGGLGPLHYAAFHNDTRAIEALAAQGYDLDDRESGESPLVSAVKHQSADAVRTLIALGADVGVKAANGASLLQLAGKDEEIKRVIRAARTGAAIDRGMGEGATAAAKKTSFDSGVL